MAGARDERTPEFIRHRRVVFQSGELLRVPIRSGRRSRLLQFSLTFSVVHLLNANHFGGWGVASRGRRVHFPVTNGVKHTFVSCVY